MILVTGASGHLGTAVVANLLKKVPASQIVALVRDEKKSTALQQQGVNIQIGDYNDIASLDNAMKGVTKVLLISSTTLTRLTEHKNAVDAAKRANVEQIAYTGVTMKGLETSPIKPLMTSHFETEEYIKAGGLPYTFLRNSLYTDMLPVYVGNQVLNTSVIIPAGNGKVPYASREDMAEAAANVLTEQGHSNKTYHLTGNALYSFYDIAALLSDLSGKEITYTDKDPAAFQDQLKQMGVPEIRIQVLSGFAASIKNGEFELVHDDLARLLGREPSPVAEFLKKQYS
ncbi:SDR family oxidoreductase [Chitinophaga sp. YIM B06452]|uniref:SDR family oxidoreductase n=1 Tax=Chitinophaga sp. YIM B06452 TaxID=3082158 RepID=UPI0031FEFBE7